MFDTLTLPAPAKLNLFLHIVGRRADGYHQLQTIFQLLALSDELQFERTRSGGVQFSCSNPALESPDNLVVRAARALENATGQSFHVRIHLHKILPMGGGIGGGSSDCATTLLALNRLFQLHLDNARLQQIGLTLGADVPIFVHGKSAWAEGIGEQLSDLALPAAHYILVYPKVHVGTAALFQHPELTRNTPLSTIRPALAESGRNDFEALVRKLYPEIDLAFRQCAAFGSPKLTGTGACLFIKVADEQTAQANATVIEQQNPALSAWATHSLAISPVQSRLDPFK